MPVSDAVEIVGSIAITRLAGVYTFPNAVAQITSAILRTRELDSGKLLIVTTQIAGFDSPSIAARYDMAREFADAARGHVRVAMATRPEFIEPDKFAVIAARNFGLVSDVFESEENARAWLTR